MTLVDQQTAARDALISCIYPTSLHTQYGISYSFSLTPAALPPNQLDKIISFLSDVVKVEGSDVSSLPAPLFYRILDEYEEFYIDATHSLLSSIKVYSDTPESQRLWRLIRATSPEYVFGKECAPLNFFREYWAALCCLQDKQETWETITTVFDAAKPWMNAELYQKIQKQSSVRQNALMSDEDLDKRLIEQGRLEAARRKAESSDDIYIEKGRKKRGS